MKACVTCVLIILAAATRLAADAFTQVNLVSDISGLALTTDSLLKDPWGMSFSVSSPIWVSDRATGVATLYTGTGTKVALTVTIPPGTPTQGPTGQIFAGPTTAFTLNGSPASFIFDTLGGTIDAWNGGTTATVVATTAGARYEGLAIDNNTLYAANFTSGGGIDVYSSSYVLQAATGFIDPSLPAGYAPFNVQTIGGNIYVTYGLLTPGVPVPLPGGGGFVDVYTPGGALVKRLISGGALDAPWGITMAPAGFGSFGGDLLVGNFGNGQINAFNPSTGVFLGTIMDVHGNPIVNSGLWALNFGNGSNGANPNDLYFTAGLNMGNDGLFGMIDPVPEPATLGLIGLGCVGIGLARRRRGVDGYFHR